MGDDGVYRWGLNVEAQLKTMINSKLRGALLTNLCLALLLSQPPRAHSQQTAPNSSTDPKPAAEKYFTDVVLVDQYGQQKRLFTDLMKDKVVIVHSFISTCTGACPVINAQMQALQKAFGDKLGNTVHLISISVDPVADTPERLKAYSQRSGAKAGWYFLTGEKANVDFALKKFGLFVENKEAHLTTMLIGNLSTGLWRKAFGLAEIQEIIKLVESVINDGGK